MAFARRLVSTCSWSTGAGMISHSRGGLANAAFPRVASLALRDSGESFVDRGLVAIAGCAQPQQAVGSGGTGQRP